MHCLSLSQKSPNQATWKNCAVNCRISTRSRLTPPAKNPAFTLTMSPLPWISTSWKRKNINAFAEMKKTLCFWQRVGFIRRCGNLISFFHRTTDALAFQGLGSGFLGILRIINGLLRIWIMNSLKRKNRSWPILDLVFWFFLDLDFTGRFFRYWIRLICINQLLVQKYMLACSRSIAVMP